MKRLLFAAAALWVLRWAVLMLAAYLEHRRPRVKREEGGREPPSSEPV